MEGFFQGWGYEVAGEPIPEEGGGISPGFEEAAVVEHDYDAGNEHEGEEDYLELPELSHLCPWEHLNFLTGLVLVSHMTPEE